MGSQFELLTSHLERGSFAMFALDAPQAVVYNKNI